MPSCDTPAGRCASLSSLPLPPSLPLSHSPPPLRRCLIKGPEHRLDISFSASGDAPTRDHPHGIIGQSFATPGRVRNGKTDHYPFHGYYVTSAQAEGAIEGTASQYEVVLPYATQFTFSRFGAAVRPLPRLKATGRVDASSIDRVPVMEVAEAPATHAPPTHTHRTLRRLLSPPHPPQQRRLSEAAPCPPPSAATGQVPTTSLSVAATAGDTVLQTVDETGFAIGDIQSGHAQATNSLQGWRCE